MLTASRKCYRTVHWLLLCAVHARREFAREVNSPKFSHPMTGEKGVAVFGILQTMIGGAAAGIGFAVGVGATLAGSQRFRPLARDAVKGALAITERAKEMTAGLAESLEDIYAEAKSEREAEAKAAAMQ